MTETEKSAANRTPSPAGSAASDNENSERPVREQLKKTSIDAHKALSHPEDEVEPRRKRSREEVDKDTEEESRHDTTAGRHSRKRSRDVENDSSEDISTAETSAAKSDASSDVGRRPTTPSKMDVSTEQAEVERLTSPKGKRNREQFLKDSDDVTTQSLNGATVAPVVDENAKDQTLAGSKEEERDAKRHRDDIAKATTEAKDSTNVKKENVTIPPGSGFANVSASSPFANLSGKKTAEPAPASKSAFESSGFSKLAQSSTSPFASIGSSGATSSPFGKFGSALKSTPAETGSKSPEPATKSGFGALGGSALGASTGFGGFASSSPFGSALSAKPGASTFGSASPFGAASSKPGITGLSSKPVKPFGAPQSDSESEGDDDTSDCEEGGEDTTKEEETKKEKRLQEIDWETGEEQEHTLFSSRAKLYVFDAGTWKERGTGILKLNVSKRDSDSADDNEDSEAKEEKPSDDAEVKPPRKARFILRAEGSHRLVLNTPFSKNMSFGGDSSGSKPTGSALLFTGFLEGQDKMSMLQVKMKAGNVLALWEAAEDIRKVI